jgi:hypothetical protein
MSVNESEARLAELSRQTFLSMWSYQNPFYEQGKELCDVLIVYGDDVIVMSDKVIPYKEHEQPGVAWRRWYERAVSDSVNQLRGAKKTITLRPNSIYLDAKASSPFPLELPKVARIHLIAIAHGCEGVCQQVFGRPSLVVDSRPSTQGKEFHVGVYFPEFVHVLNRTALDALFECFDTTVDLIHYLREREQLFAGGAAWVHGEEDLIALHMRIRQPGGAGGIATTVGKRGSDEPAAVPDEWERLSQSSRFLNRREELAASYLIDNVIEQLAWEFESETMLIGQDLALAVHEKAFRTLASEPRMARLMIGHALADVLTEDPRTYWSVAVESPEHSDVLYVWLIYPEVDDDEPDEELERDVGSNLGMYVFVAMAKFPNHHRFYGIAMPNIESQRTSRMFIFSQRNVWNDEMQQEAELLSRRHGIFSHIDSSTIVVTRSV